MRLGKQGVGAKPPPKREPGGKAPSLESVLVQVLFKIVTHQSIFYAIATSVILFCLLRRGTYYVINVYFGKHTFAPVIE